MSGSSHRVLAGRLRKEPRRLEQVAFRVTVREKIKLRTAARRLGTSLSAYLRDVAIKKATEDLAPTNRRSHSQLLVVSNAPSKEIATLTIDLGNK